MVWWTVLAELAISTQGTADDKDTSWGQYGGWGGVLTAGGEETYKDVGNLHNPFDFDSFTSEDSFKNVFSGGWSSANDRAKERREERREDSRKNTVTQAFNTYLGRPPTDDELALYNDAIVAEQLNSPEDVRDSLQGTDEYASYSANRKAELIGPGFDNFDYSGFSAPESVNKYLGTAGTVSRDGSTVQFEESPELKAKRLAEMEEFNSILDEVGFTSEERASQIDEQATLYKKQFLSDTQAPLEQALIGRGLRGSSAYSESLVDLFSQAGDLSVMRREDLYNAEESRKMNMLNLLQGSITSDYNTGFSGAQIGGQELQFREGQRNQYDANLLNQLFAENARKQQYELSQQQFAESMFAQEEANKENAYLENTYAN